MREVITYIVSNVLSRKEASSKIVQEARTLPPHDQERFIEIIETELMSLHEGNFARYWITPSEFQQWKDAWEYKK